MKNLKHKLKKFFRILHPLTSKGPESVSKYYSRNEWYILSKQPKELQMLGTYLKFHPKVKVEINIYSELDQIQQDKYQDWQKLAYDAIDYLIALGIEDQQLTWKNFRGTTIPCFRLKRAY